MALRVNQPRLRTRPSGQGQAVVSDGAVISLPESASLGSADADPNDRGGRIDHLREAEDGAGQTAQHRESLPNRNHVDAGDPHVLLSQRDRMVEDAHYSLGTAPCSVLAEGVSRKLTLTRSSTEPNLTLLNFTEISLAASREELVEETPRPPGVRKKTGELVRPSLRPPSRRRHSGMPSTPTFSKSVHFDSHEHVRHFLQVDRPLAVSAGSSPVENSYSSNEDPFLTEEHPGDRPPPYKWEIVTTGFPVESPIRKTLPVRLERLWLSDDQECLLGSVAVANLAFQKLVACRFTFDYWNTTSEVAAEYSHGILCTKGLSGHDRFTFAITLSDLVNLEHKTLYFCLRYIVNGQEFWDNNNGANFRAEFRKQRLPQNAKNLGQSLHECLGESGPALHLMANKAGGNLPSGILSNLFSASSGQAFAGRYDFSASLAAAVPCSKGSTGMERDKLYIKRHKARVVPEQKATEPQEVD